MNIKNGELHILPFRQFLPQLERSGHQIHV